MCGIFGVFSRRELQEAPLDLFTELLQLNGRRGDKAYGIMAAGFVLKQASCPTPAIMDALKAFVHPYGTKFILGHLRAPTEGAPNDISNTHPFQYGVYSVAHNGNLLNHKSLRDELIYTRDSPATDSAILPVLLQSFEGAEGPNIGEALSKLEGSYALWIYHHGLNELYLARCINPIYWKEDSSTGIVTFSSEKIEGADLLPEGKVFRVSDLEVVDEFRYYNPYQLPT